MTDARHVRNALARFDQVEGVSDAERDRAFAKIKKQRATTMSIFRKKTGTTWASGPIRRIRATRDSQEHSGERLPIPLRRICPRNYHAPAAAKKAGKQIELK